MAQEKKVDLRDIALRWAKIAYPLMTHEDQMEAESFFPELKENEDERMMNQLHSWMKEFGGAEEYTEKVYLWLKGLLEKQGEQKPSTDFSNLRTWKYIVDAVLTEKDGIGQYLDESFTEEVAKKLQKRFGNIEQKPVDEIQSAMSQLSRRQNQEWKEHDELTHKVEEAFVRSLGKFFSRKYD